MATIELRFRYAAHPHQVYRALTEQSQLAGWWTDSCSATAKVASTATFEFKPDGGCVTFLVESLLPGRVVQWRCTESSEELSAWCGTTVRFEIAVDGDQTALRLAHTGWRSEESLEKFQASWDDALGRKLKSLLEPTTSPVATPKASELDQPRKVVQRELAQ